MTPDRDILTSDREISGIGTQPFPERDSSSDLNRMPAEAQKPDDAHWSPEETPIPVSSGAPSEEAVVEAIATVHDPEIPVNIYELGLIYAINLHENGHVKVEMTLTAPNCPSAQELPVQVKEAVEKADRVTSVDVEVVWDPPWDMSRMSDEARLALNMF